MHLRSWLPDYFALEAQIEMEPMDRWRTRLRARFQVPLANRVIVGTGLMLLVGVPFVGVVISGADNLAQRFVPFLALPLLYFLVVPLAYRLYRGDERQLMQFLENALPEAERWEPEQR